MISDIKQATSVDAVKRLCYSSRLEDLHSVDLVVEAIVESEQVKKSLFANLDKIVKSSAILASNTSSISITRLASATSRPSQVCFTWLLIDWTMAYETYWKHNLVHMKICGWLLMLRKMAIFKQLHKYLAYFLFFYSFRKMCWIYLYLVFFPFGLV